MGVPKFPLVDQKFEENCDLINGSLLNNVWEGQAKSKTRVVNRKTKQKSYKNSLRRVSMKRQQARLGLMKANGVERRVRTLKRLIPHNKSIGFDGLFRETADYILSLQMRVRVMQNLVKVLTGSDQK